MHIEQEGLLGGKVVCVTGGESGIGRCIAMACAQAGASVCVAGFDATRINGVVAEIQALGRQALGMVTDIRDPAQVDAMIAAVDHQWGRLDAAFANTGGTQASGPTHETSLAEWDAGVKLNLTGTFLTLTAAARYLVRQGEGGVLMATGSSTAVRVVPDACTYIAPKAAVHALVSIMALELAPHRIRVNALIPGPTDTPALRAIPGHAERAAASVPLGELVDPAEIGRLAAFAASDALRHMTGTQLCIDSGRIIA